MHGSIFIGKIIEKIDEWKPFLNSLIDQTNFCGSAVLNLKFIHTPYYSFLAIGVKGDLITGGEFCKKDKKVSAILKWLNQFEWIIKNVILDIKFIYEKNFSFLAQGRDVTTGVRFLKQIDRKLLKIVCI